MPRRDSDQGSQGPSDDPFDVVLDEDFVRAATVKEGGPVPGPPVPERPHRVWPRNVAFAAAAAALTFVAFKFLGQSADEDTSAAPPAATASRTASASPAVSGPPGTGGPAAPLSARPMVPPAEAFPAQVKGAGGTVFTKVGAAVLKSCTEPDSVGPLLATMIEESKGCVGQQVALYKDAQNNQFNLAVFTMKDPLDTVHLLTRLSMVMDSYQVGAQAPPPGSGLPTLPPDSGMVQSFTGQGRAMVVGLGQWSDGRVAEYQKLVDRLQPLLKGVSEKVAAYEEAVR